MNTIISALNDYGECVKITSHFSVESLMKKMEPIFDEKARMRKKAGKSTRILIMHGGGVGDFILFSPCLREIRRIYENAYITLLVCPSSLNMAEVCPYVNEVFACAFLHDIYAENTMFYAQCIDYIKQYFTDTFDIAFNYAVCFSGCMLAYMSGARTRFLHVNSWYWNIFNRQIPYCFAEALSTELPTERKFSPHCVDLYLSVLDHMLHAFLNNREIEVWYTTTDEAVVENSLSWKEEKKYIVLCMGGLGGFKSYPPEKYAQLLQMIIAEDNDIHVFIIGGTAEELAGDLVCSRLPKGIVTNLTGVLTFRQTAALMAKCDYYIGNDTSCMHIAAAVKLPVLTVFSYPANIPREECSVVEKYYPYHVPAVVLQPDKALPGCGQSNSKVHKLFGCFENHSHCIAQVSVEEMYEGWRIIKA